MKESGRLGGKKRKMVEGGGAIGSFPREVHGSCLDVRDGLMLPLARVIVSDISVSLRVLQVLFLSSALARILCLVLCFCGSVGLLNLECELPSCRQMMDMFVRFFIANVPADLSFGRVP